MNQVSRRYLAMEASRAKNEAINFVGLNLLQSAFTNWCPMIWLLSKAGFIDADVANDPNFTANKAVPAVFLAVERFSGYLGRNRPCAAMKSVPSSIR
jgi:hypothetical protein